MYRKHVRGLNRKVPEHTTKDHNLHAPQPLVHSAPHLPCSMPRCCPRLHTSCLIDKRFQFLHVLFIHPSLCVAAGSSDTPCLPSSAPSAAFRLHISRLIDKRFQDLHVSFIHPSLCAAAGSSETPCLPSSAPAAAFRLHISRLIDKRFQGMAMGVGTSRIIGRIHQV